MRVKNIRQSLKNIRQSLNTQTTFQRYLNVHHMQYTEFLFRDILYEIPH
jgi:hypothetical protein